MPKCKKCGSENIVKNGFVRGKQRYRSNKCGYNFVEGDGRTARLTPKKALAILLYGLGSVSLNMIATLFDTSTSLILRQLQAFGLGLPDPVIPETVQHIQFDEMWHFLHSKDNKLWLIKALDAQNGKVLAWVLGKRDIATWAKSSSFSPKRLYAKVKHLNTCTFYTDDWDAFSAVLPKERHIVGKIYTFAIEQNNSNTRHHLARFTRRTKVVSKCKDMVDTTLKIGYHLTSGDLFRPIQSIALSIFLVNTLFFFCMTFVHKLYCSFSKIHTICHIGILPYSTNLSCTFMLTDYMLSSAKARGLEPEMVVADSWYSSFSWLALGKGS